MPEQDSSADTLELSGAVADALGIELLVEDITPVLEALGCYVRRDEAIRKVIPEYGPGWRAKIVRPALLGADQIRLFSAVAESPAGVRHVARLSAEAYRGIVAATNFKQRARKMLEYHHADRLHYAVVGTPNRLEYDQGFFVKNGDGAADVKPIAHLYKTQVYELAAFLGLPDAVIAREPTTDTYALDQTQDEFYFGVPYQVLDLCLYAHNRGLPAESVGCGRTVERGRRARLPRHRDEAPGDRQSAPSTAARRAGAGDRTAVTQESSAAAGPAAPPQPLPSRRGRRKQLRQVARSIFHPATYLHAFRILHYYGYSHVQERRRLTMGPGSTIAPNVSMANAERITIGAGTKIGERSSLWAGETSGHIRIGDHCRFATEVFITASDYRLLADQMIA
jgi:NAD+ synthase